MTAPDAHEPDDLDALLDAPTTSAPVGDALRHELLARTSRVIRRRRHVRRTGLLGLVACAYLAGVLTMNLRATQQDVIVAERPGASPRSGQDESATEDAPVLGMTHEEGSAYVVGESIDLNRYEVFCSAADRHLNETGNYTAALNLYRQALNAASEDQLAIAAGSDTWLLMALKNSRQKERNHAIPEI